MDPICFDGRKAAVRFKRKKGQRTTSPEPEVIKPWAFFCEGQMIGQKTLDDERMAIKEPERKTNPLSSNQ